MLESNCLYIVDAYTCYKFLHKDDFIVLYVFMCLLMQVDQNVLNRSDQLDHVCSLYHEFINCA